MPLNLAFEFRERTITPFIIAPFVKRWVDDRTLRSVDRGEPLINEKQETKLIPELSATDGKNVLQTISFMNKNQPVMKR